MKSNYLKVLLTFAVAGLLMNIQGSASDNDTRIESAVYNSYVFKTYLNKDDITIKSSDGIVTMTGTVAEESHKLLALDTAGNLAGVKSVENKLVTKAEVEAINADNWIERKIKLALLFHRNVDAGNTDIQVKDGIVKLTGKASSMAQKELTSEYASDIDGVKEVKNEMTVVETPKMKERTPYEKMDDASITAQVKSALLTHRSTSAVKTKVETRDGKVELTGIVQNEAEKSLVTKLISDIQGVTSVSNLMTVNNPKTK